MAQKRSECRLLMVYINGILSGTVQYPVDDNFSKNAPAGISSDSNSCTTGIYCTRIYDNNLPRFHVLDNRIADTQVGLTKKQRYACNEAFDDYCQIIIDQFPTELPYLILEATELPLYKGVNPVTPSRFSTFTGAQADVQGTFSQYYTRKNYKIKFKDGLTVNRTVPPAYQMRDDNADTYSNPNLAELYLGNNVLMQTIDVHNCPHLTQAVYLSGCTKPENLYFDGTAIND